MRHSTSSRNDDSLQFTCPQCLAWLKAPPATGGTQQRCPRCQLVFEVPRETQTRVRGELYPVQPVGTSAATNQLPGISVTCPVCHTRIHGVVEQLGQKVECPDCGTSVTIPPPPVLSQPIAPPRVVEEYPLHDETPAISGGVAANESLIRLNCLLCHTMMYATADQVGQALVCPDCGTSTIVLRPPERPGRKLGLQADTIGEYELAEEVDHSRGALRAMDQQYIPVVCSLCHTRMMATLDQVGTRKVCPDCGTATAVPPPPPRRREIDVMAGAGRGYRSVPPPPPPPLVGQQREPPQDERPLELPPERPVLPRWPFLVGTFSFPLSAGACGSALLVALWGLAAAGLARESVLLGANGDGRAMFLSAMFGAGALILTAMASAYASACALTIVRETGNGCERIQEWPGLAFLDWMGDLLYLVDSLCMSVGPGVGFAWLLARNGQQSTPAIPVSMFLLFPIVLLSMLESGSPFGAISWPVCRTFWTAWRGWVAFYLTSAALSAAAGIVVITAIFIKEPWAVVATATTLVVAGFIYFRLLGRLAWYCAEHTTRRELEHE